ncbi:phenylalanine--tRNA ligase subunit beta [Leptospira ognonensis]|uniref:Phenylalanine--tRNA ligase beta subunit n=1 Tax=Leptospira ognonensis TaxID=2484945 RepID=A0A4R9JUG3_9LEPT|nr:phenylalanine--tRNA ligase subunit beta [Leptospira ognonensis]TGL56432.1 phenylalanine--tRNA ligase subunit beta [Leptospira ognonensis]
MKLSIHWLNDFIPLNSIPFSTVLEKINTSICEIDDVENFKEHLTNIITVKITAAEKHPNAEKLQVTKCTDGKKTYQIVTAATNIQVSDIVPLALPGTKVDGKEILASELRGVPSEGMYCSEKELGLADVSTGVLVYPDSTQIGIGIRKLYNWEDTILTIDNKSITHRPDLWSHFGFARELAAQLEIPISFDPLKINADSKPGEDGVKVIANDNAHAYYACSIQNVKVSPSTTKIKSRLEKCGIRSINNVVDVSNYLLLEIGQPTHFFDRDKLESSEFSVDFAKQEESFPLLDDSEPKLSSEVLLIRNGNTPVAIAGVMGGKESAVGDHTSNIILESAIFKREDVRKSIRKSGIRTESAVRYEKGLDTSTCLPVIHRALQLLSENGGKDFHSFTPQGFNHTADKKVFIETNLDFLNQKLGKVLNISEIQKIFERLSFKFESKDNQKIRVEVPRHRHNYDVTIEEDLVEEIGRTIGYASIPTKPLSLAIEALIRNPLRELERKIKAYFSSTMQFHEVLNYSFSSEKESMMEGIDAKTILAIANEMSPEHSVLRASLLPGLIRQAASNQDRFESVDLFEIGRTYHKDGKKEDLASEKRWLGFISLSKSKPNDLHAIENEFVQLRHRLVEALSSLNLRDGYFERTHLPHLHPNVALVYKIENTVVAEYGLLHARYSDQYDLKKRAFVGKINLLALLEIWEREGRKSHFRSPSQFPQGQLDVSILLDEKDPTEQYLDLVTGLKIPELETGYVHTIFRGESIGTQKKSVTYRFKLMSYEKTFTQERFKNISDSLVDLAKSSGFQMR